MAGGLVSFWKDEFDYKMSEKRQKRMSLALIMLSTTPLTFVYAVFHSHVDI